VRKGKEENMKSKLVGMYVGEKHGDTFIIEGQYECIDPNCSCEGTWTNHLTYADSVDDAIRHERRIIENWIREECKNLPPHEAWEMLQRVRIAIKG